ncbi:unnamed protein product [Lactuca saligna]|uniref:Homeobox domain-containing protein n=1 Tax=Lactuca saligna TaxID=75948 RepID=A0AA35Z691_LACSI|nr:unnamed protein product [Lactuca saligna]
MFHFINCLCESILNVSSMQMKKDRRKTCQITYQASTMKESINLPIENLIMCIPNDGGIHDSNVSQQRFCESNIDLLRDCKNHCLNTIVDFPLSDENSQDSKSYLHGFGKVISDSKYLKATQNLLDDVVNVKKAMKQHCKHDYMNNSKEALMISENKLDSRPISAAEKQDLQSNMTKLTSMLNEVDRRYKQYYHQMQIVVSSFEAIAGCGASIPYTTLILQTISCQFRFIKDAIKSQIQVISTRLGRTELNEEGIGIPRLRFVDQKVRKQSRAMHRHIGRPQRGLPESCVSILRAWLFEHFLHPYPKDSEKNMLARQTGLSKTQVTNWFINARVRLWKPMVEEMHKQESIDSSTPKVA